MVLIYNLPFKLYIIYAFKLRIVYGSSIGIFSELYLLILNIRSVISIPYLL